MAMTEKVVGKVRTMKSQRQESQFYQICANFIYYLHSNSPIGNTYTANMKVFIICFSLLFFLLFNCLFSTQYVGNYVILDNIDSTNYWRKYDWIGWKLPVILDPWSASPLAILDDWPKPSFLCQCIPTASLKELQQALSAT